MMGNYIASKQQKQHDEKKDNIHIQSNNIVVENSNQKQSKEQSPKVDRSMLITCFQQNDFTKADSIAKILLDSAKDKYGAESVEVWSASMEYIEVQKRLKKDREALELYLELETLTVKLFGDQHENSASVFNNIAMLYYHTFQHAKTIPYFKKTLAIWEKTYPENDQRIILTRNNIFVNQQMSFFDVQSQKHGVKIHKMDFTRDLSGRKPQTDDQNNNNDDEFKNDPKRMAAFTAAIDEKFAVNKVNKENENENENAKAILEKEDSNNQINETDEVVSNNSDFTQQTDDVNNDITDKSDVTATK